ncbi:ParB/RepB/Spo0J family partition protein [Caproicibacter fermentans]|uniref:ParB/RepB/Spo0J family partition protein n=1 Tax=Caproicibacter fermentans TaxID=2576756 RepID=A0A7G8T7B0_9FIRM|nr:ParB/RepB/Spo0J family partition protein [Caproicibacter fermentans]QNK39501.1 ParB/RepB/Spo0J family partition protein [Caproicibacter fermentans]
MAGKKGGLGKGLDAIFLENDLEGGQTSVNLSLDEIEPNRGQPRREFNEEALQELAESIRQHGVLQPLLVRPIFSGGYQIVAGERRWRAARMAELKEVPAVVREMSDSEVMQLALIENLQREDLNPLEEAQGYQSLIETYGMTQEEVANTVGKSRPAVANALRLLNLPEEVRGMVEKGVLSAGHARTLLSFPSRALMMEAAKAAAEGASVREIEKMAQRANSTPKAKKSSSKIKFYEETELALRESLGRKVNVTGSSKRGMLQIEFYGQDDLTELIRRIHDNT